MTAVRPDDHEERIARILRGELPQTKVFEDSHVIAFVPLQMQSRGHVLVISKTSRARHLGEIESVELTKIVLTALRVARAQRVAFIADGLRIIHNNRDTARRSAFHLHVIPMYGERAFRSSEGPDDPGEELEVVARQIAGALLD